MVRALEDFQFSSDLWLWRLRFEYLLLFIH